MLACMTTVIKTIVYLLVVARVFVRNIAQVSVRIATNRQFSMCRPRETGPCHEGD